MMQYVYAHRQTEATTGYFSCEPETPLSVPQLLAYLAAHPFDSFMRRHGLQVCSNLPVADVAFAFAAMREQGAGAEALPLALVAFAHELAMVSAQGTSLLPALLGPSALREEGSLVSPVALEEASPLVLLRWQTLADGPLHAAWGKVFTENMAGHRLLVAPGATGLAPLYTQEPAAQPEQATVQPHIPGTAAVFRTPLAAPLAQLKEAVAAPFQGKPGYTRPPAEETAALAAQRLEECGIIDGEEMRHVASLSPVALMRPWRVRLQVQGGRHAFSLKGKATTYGRGLSVGAARASCLMEMVERASLYVSVAGGQVLHRAAPMPLVQARRSELVAQGHFALNPQEYPLEAPCGDPVLHWVEGHNAKGEAVWVPLQMVTLFSNLDEIDLFDSLGSTGIATGNTLAEAKVAALTEIIERDAEATSPYVKQGCFTLQAEHDPELARLLVAYRQCGIHVHVQDLTGPLGVPVYKCFAMSPKGQVARGFGAGLNGKRALVSALTETPFPFPGGGPSGPMLRGVPQSDVDSLPNHSLGSPEADLALLEEALCASGRMPVYVVMTHEALQFPVVRAFVPGMELAADRDTFSRIPYRLWENYLRQFAEE